MEPHPDFKELLVLLNEHRVEYLIVGGYALAFYGAPRFTGDLDLLVKQERINTQRLLDALDEFGFGSLNLSTTDFERPDQVVQLGVPPVRVDFLTSISGVSWEDAWADRTEGFYAEVPVHYLSRNHFIINKRATGRLQDRADLEALGEESDQT